MTMVDPALASAQANVAEAGPKGVNVTVMPLATKIAQAVAAGTIALPTSDSGWLNTIQQFRSSGGPIPGSTPTSTASPTAPTSAGGDVQSFLAAMKSHESGGNYSAYNAKGGASGAYQFIDSTWANAAKEAGYSDYSNGPASAAPPQVQDAVAAHMATGYFNQYGNWSDVAQAWYDPALVGQNVVPAPEAGNTQTVSGFGQQIVDMMGKQAAAAQAPQEVGALDHMGSNSAVATAMAQVGTPYVWGGETAGKAFDCSGLVQFAYAQSGVQLPRTAQAQYNATAPLPQGAALAPGDLVFFGTSTHAIEHVGIYVGNGQMVDAPHTGSTVRVQSFMGGNYVGATRPTDPGGQTVSVATTPSPGSPPTMTAAGSSASLGAYYSALNRVVSALGKYLGG